MTTGQIEFRFLKILKWLENLNIFKILINLTNKNTLEKNLYINNSKNLFLKNEI